MSRPPTLEFGLLVSIALACAACEPFATKWDLEVKDAPIFTRDPLIAPDPSDPEALKVMAYNIKFGAGRIDFWFDYWGDRVEMTEREVTGNIERISALLREYDPDVLLVEEIEVNSRRSAYYDMVAAILQGTRLNYGAYFQTWKSRYVPSEGLGRVDMGNAIFSKYPIEAAQTIPLPDRTDLDALTKEFYLHRAVGRAEIQAPGGALTAFVVHTEAYDKDGTKSLQLEKIHALVGAERGRFVLGGDFNELPPTALETTDFPDESPRAKGTDFEQPPYTPEAMQKFYDALVPAISLAEIGTTVEEQRRYYSHSTLGPDEQNDLGEWGFWNRTLDYLFAGPNQAFVPGTSDVLQTTGRLGIESDLLRLSDHAPVVGTLVHRAGDAEP